MSDDERDDAIDSEQPSAEELSPEDVQDLSNDELVELSGGGMVDAEGNVTPFPTGDSPVADDEEDLSAEESAERLAASLEDISQDSASTQQEMFTDEWMADHTDFDSIEAFLAAGTWEVAPEEGLWDVPTDELDEHAAANSEFDSWEAMSQAAGEAWLDQTLDL
jgi:hypothetical protein